MGLRPLADEIVLPRSRRRKVAVPRRTMVGEGPKSLGPKPMTAKERAETALEVAEALEAGETFGPPDDDRDCPTGPCPRVSCRHNLYIEVDGRSTTLNFPGRHIDEIPETCSLRVARAAHQRQEESRVRGEPALSSAEIGVFLNLTPQSVLNYLQSALAKLRARGAHLK